MSDKKHIIIFSHGFGVRRDARGMFTDIVRSLPDTETVMFDYNTFDEAAHSVMVRPLSEQASILTEQVKQVREKYPDALIDLICHSQGSVVAGLAGLSSFHIRKVLLLAPPETMDIERMLQNFQSRPGTIIDMHSMSRLARRDGSFTLVPALYFAERLQIEPLSLYADMAQYADVLIVKAKEDEILGPTNFSAISRVRMIELSGNHDFDHEARLVLIETIKKELL